MNNRVRSAALLSFGVTGHRGISSKEKSKLELQFSKIFHDYMNAMPNTSFLLLTALADGADQIAAEVALDLPRFEVVATLPMPLMQYLEDFPEADRTRLLDLLGRCAGCIDTSRHFLELRPDIASERDALYQICGRWISDNSEVLIAAWDGQAPVYTGGTADIVHYRVSEARSLSSAHAIGESSRGQSSLVLWCPLMRRNASQPNPEEADVRLLSAGDTCEPWFGVADDTAASIEGFNKAARPSRESRQATESLYESADELASTLQVRYRRLVQAIMGSGIFALLSIDAMQTTNNLRLAVALTFFVALTAVLMLLLYRTGIKTRFQQSRYLAEGSRVQLVWLASRLPRCPVDLQTDSVEEQMAWIRSALRSAWVLDDSRMNEAPVMVKVEAWLREQLEYFLGVGHQVGAIVRMQRRQRIIQRAAWLFLIPAIIAVGVEVAMMVVGVSPDAVSRQIVGLIWALGIGGGVGLFSYGELMGYGELGRRYALLVPSLTDAWASLANSNSVEEAQIVVRNAGLAALREAGDWLTLHTQSNVRPLW